MKRILGYIGSALALLAAWGGRFDVAAFMMTLIIWLEME